MQTVHPDKKVHFVVQEHMRGQSDAIALAREYLEGPILIAFSDTLIETDLSFLKDGKADGIAWVKPMPDPRRFGVAETGTDNRVLRLIEKPSDMSKNLVLVGFYYFKNGEKLVAAIEEQIKRGTSLKGEYFLADAINILIEQGIDLRARSTEVWLDAGVPESLLETNRYLLDHGRCTNCEINPTDHVTIVPPVSIPAGTVIESAVVGPYVTLGEVAC
jgi:glucose-1-phosphate thymidylyltransferase